VTVGMLIKKLRMADPKDEVLLIVEEVHYGGETLTGICSKVQVSGEGPEVGKCEIYAKA
jgi:hypothetical protein